MSAITRSNRVGTEPEPAGRPAISRSRPISSISRRSARTYSSAITRRRCGVAPSAGNWWRRRSSRPVVRSDRDGRCMRSMLISCAVVMCQQADRIPGRTAPGRPCLRQSHGDGVSGRSGTVRHAGGIPGLGQGPGTRLSAAARCPIRTVCRGSRSPFLRIRGQTADVRPGAASRLICATPTIRRGSSRAPAAPSITTGSG